VELARTADSLHDGEILTTFLMSAVDDVERCGRLYDQLAVAVDQLLEPVAHNGQVLTDIFNPSNNLSAAQPLEILREIPSGNRPARIDTSSYS
jgi:hypothetical protein